MGALKVLQESGIAVPAQVSVFGMDNEPILDYLQPSLSSVDSDVCLFVDRANSQLFALLRGETVQPMRPEDFPSLLVLRGSSRPLR